MAVSATPLSLPLGFICSPVLRRFAPSSTAKKFVKSRAAASTTPFVRCSLRALPESRELPIPLADGDGNDGNAGNGGRRHSGGGGDGFGSFDSGGSLTLAGAVVPIYDLSRSLKSFLTAENILLLIACLVLPVVGVYLKRNKLDNYVLLSLVLTFLPPFGITFAIAHCFFDIRPF